MSWKIEWNAQMELGNAAMDADHRALVDEFNALAADTEALRDAETAGRALAALLERTDAHFAREEALMGQAGYPLLRRHMDEHRDLSRRLGRLADRIGRGLQDCDVTVLSFVGDWLANHIIESDARFAAHVAETRAAGLEHPVLI